jgi:hypothetical protein
MSLMRWDILQHLIDQYKYESYLELGTYKFWNFDQITCKNKTAVDPNPCKDSYQESLPYGTGNVLFEDSDLAVHAISKLDLLAKMTTDEFFAALPKKVKYDLIFIDALHLEEAVTKDIWNSLEHLSKSGTVVLHDTLPKKWEHAQEQWLEPEWNGTVYKAILKFVRNDHFGRYDVRVVDTDYGCTIIQRSTITLERAYRNEEYDKALEDFNYFQENKDKLFNIITPEEFLTLYSK